MGRRKLKLEDLIGPVAAERWRAEYTAKMKQERNRERAEIRAELLGKTTERVRQLLYRLNALRCRDTAIAQHLEVSRATVSQWRAGRSAPTKKHMADLEWLLAKFESGEKR